MKKILCFGDSNTYGFVPKTCKRYSKEERWSGILGNLLGEGYQVTEQGLNNRTGFFKNPESIKHCGMEYLPIYLQNHRDFDICILALGTNDAQFFYNLNEDIIKNGLQSMINSLLEANPSTKIIIVPPVKIQRNILNGIFSMQFDMNSVENMEKTFPIYKDVAIENNCLYLDFNRFVAPSDIDGLHYSTHSHKIIACKVCAFIQLNNL